jgi:RNA polymerase sigma factor (sigma-70 family)
LVQGDVATAGRKRAAVELIAREGADLSRTARRYSLCAEDAEDAYQRALEILLLKAPNDRPRDLIRWTKTVVKHEALAIRRNRERLLGTPATRTGERGEDDPIAQIAASGDGPVERLELSEQVGRSREALQALKPAELRSLTLLAAGYSYAEIGRITGFSQTKVNRCLAEGRERFRRIVSGSEDGTRCAEMEPLLSAFCDGEANGEEEIAVREHLRACAGCRATMRAYRTAPAAVAALAPALPMSRSLLDRAYELLAWVHSRLPGGGAADTGMAQVAVSGGTRGAGMAAIAKALAICAGTVGGATACVVTGVAPTPLDLGPRESKTATIARVAKRPVEPSAPAVGYQPAAADATPRRSAGQEKTKAQPVEPTSASEAGAVEYVAAAPESAPAPPTEPAPAPSGSAVQSPAPAGSAAVSPSGGAAGEFGP